MGTRRHRASPGARPKYYLLWRLREHNIVHRPFPLRFPRRFTLNLRPRSLWRKQVPFGPEEIRRTERWLATARVFLAISALVVVWLDPAEIRSVWAYACSSSTLPRALP